MGTVCAELSSVTRATSNRHDSPVIVSLFDTSKSTIKMLAELWYVLWHEAHH